MNLGRLFTASVKELELSGILTAEIDVKLMLGDILDKDSSFFFSHPEALVSNPAYQRFRQMIRRRKTGEPVAYILGWKEFYGMRFKVNKNVLIPRPETEMMIDLALDRISNIEYGIRNKKQISILDIGTGSGCIIISLLKNNIQYSKFNILAFASDISEKALKVAKINAKSNEVDDLIKFYKSDLLSSDRLPKNIDVILANLPYGPRGVKNPRINYHDLSFEPQNALFADKKGLDLIEKLIIQISKRNYKPKLILLEIFEDHPEPIKKLTEKYLPEYQFELKQDYANLNRLIILSLSKI
jgi:release factor glutamine methyltransferase